MSYQTRFEHADKTYYGWADRCGHAEPDRGSPEWSRWNAEHGPGGEGGDERICMLTPIGEFCEVCTDENEGDEAGCRVRPTTSERRIAAAEAICSCPCGHDDGGSCGTCAWVHKNLTAKCPLCLADPGERCVDFAAGTVSWFHAQRREAAGDPA